MAIGEWNTMGIAGESSAVGAMGTYSTSNYWTQQEQARIRRMEEEAMRARQSPADRAWQTRGAWLRAWVERYDGFSPHTWDVGVSDTGFPVSLTGSPLGYDIHSAVTSVRFELQTGLNYTNGDTITPWYKIVSENRTFQEGPMDTCPFRHTSDMGYRWNQPPQARETNAMNYSTAIFLVNTDVQAVNVSYELDANGKPVSVVPYKTLSREIKVGDFVIVPIDTRHKMTVGRVEEVDVEVDLDSRYQMKWVVGVVDKAAYDAILNMEQEGITKIKSAEKLAKKKELADKLLADNPDLASLQNLGKPSALPAE